MKMPDIECPPYAPVLMESTRAIGYSIESAIADIIDNSISASATKIEIFYNIIPHPYIAILDNGNAMNSNEITESMRYGSSSPSEERVESDLGRYGLGMKMASLSQCRSMSVVSKRKNEIVARRWNLDHIIKTKSWSLEQLGQDEINELPLIKKLLENEKGTIVIWESLDRIKSGSLTLEKSLEEKMVGVKEHLELVFHRYLSGERNMKLSISINGIKLCPFDPFFIAKSTQPMAPEKIDIPGRKGKVVVTPYILPHPSNMTKLEIDKYGGKDGLRALQGFYIYRNRRLLTWGTWFGLIKKDEFTKLARVQVDIPNSLDDLWTLDVKKSTAYPPEIVKTRLKQLVGTMSNGSKRTWLFRQKKEISSTKVHVWEKVETREGIKYIVNQEHPILEALNDRLENNERKLLKEYIDTIQNSLPFNNLHYDMHRDVKIAYDSEDDTKKRTLSIAKMLIEDAIKDNSIEKIMNNFEITEPFSAYIPEIKKICQEVKINGRY